MLSSGVGVIHHLCSRVELHVRLQGLPVRFIHTLTGLVLSSIASHPFDSYIQSPSGDTNIPSSPVPKLLGTNAASSKFEDPFEPQSKTHTPNYQK